MSRPRVQQRVQVEAAGVQTSPLTTSFTLVGPWDPMERTLMQAVLPLAVPLAWRLADFGRRQLGLRRGTPPTHAHLVIGRWAGEPETDASFYWGGPTVVVELDQVMGLGEREHWPLRLVTMLAHEFLHLLQMGRAPRLLAKTLTQIIHDPRPTRSAGETGRPSRLRGAAATAPTASRGAAAAAGAAPTGEGPRGEPTGKQIRYEDAWNEQEASWLDSRTTRAFGLRVRSELVALFPFTPKEMLAWQPLVAHYRAAAVAFGPPLVGRDLPAEQAGPLSVELHQELQRLWPQVTGRPWPARISAANRERFALALGASIHTWLEARMDGGARSIWLGHRTTQQRLARALPQLLRRTFAIARHEDVGAAWRPLKAPDPTEGSRWDVLAYLGLAETWAAARASRLAVVRLESRSAPLLHRGALGRLRRVRPAVPSARPAPLPPEAGAAARAEHPEGSDPARAP